MKTRTTSATLSDIIGVAVEYDLHLKPNEFIQYLDLYSTYISSTESSSKSVKQTSVVAPVTFFKFISSRSLLELAASMTSIETGEQLMAPAPLQIAKDSELENNDLNSGS